MAMSPILTKKLVSGVFVFLVVCSTLANEPGSALRYQSAFLDIAMSPYQPAIMSLAVDSLGKSKLGPNPLRPPEALENKFLLVHTRSKFEYRVPGAPSSAPPAWTFEFSARQMHLRSVYSTDNPPPALVL